MGKSCGKLREFFEGKTCGELQDLVFTISKQNKEEGGECILGVLEEEENRGKINKKYSET